MTGGTDWATLRARLAAAEAALGQGELTPEQRDAILARRAEALSAPVAAEAAADRFEALVFMLGDEYYAFPSHQVQEVHAIDQLAALPGAPAWIAGLINVRGRIVPVLDLRPLFGLPGTSPGCDAALLIASPRGAVGILPTGQPSLRWLRSADLASLPPGAPAGLDPAYVRGVTPDLIVVLDAAPLLADERLLVQANGQSGSY